MVAVCTIVDKNERLFFTEYFLMVYRVLLEYTIITEYSVKVLGAEYYRVLGKSMYSVPTSSTKYICILCTYTVCP